jgi:hypothetical protein
MPGKGYVYPPFFGAGRQLRLSFPTGKVYKKELTPVDLTRQACSGVKNNLSEPVMRMIQMIYNWFRKSGKNVSVKPKYSVAEITQ